MKNRRSVVLLAVALIAVLAAIAAYRSGGSRSAGGGWSSGAAASGHVEVAARTHPRPAAPQRVASVGGEVLPADEGVIGHLRGRVVSATDGQPIARAEITFVGPDGSHSVRTDDGGGFDFAPDREGLYEITLVTAPSFTSFAAELGASPIALVTRKGMEIAGITLRLAPAVDYLGLVVDPRGRPVSGADVRVFDADHVEFALAGFATRHTTDDKGEFRFRAPDGSILEARHAGFAPGRTQLRFEAQWSKRLVITLPEASATEPLGAIRGTVVDGSGLPLPDVTVIARVEAENPAADGERLNPGGGARTDARGAFSLEGLVEGSYSVTASDGDHAPTTRRPVRTGEPPIELVVTRGATLTGHVTDEKTGAPIAGIGVAIAERRGPVATQLVRTATVFDSTGRYTVRHLAPGRYIVSISAEGYAPSTDRDITIERDDVTVDVALSRGARLVGDVRDAKTKEPIASAKVSVEGQYGASEGTAALSPAAVTDRAGHFELGGLGPGEKSFLVAGSGHHARVLGGLVFRGTDVVGPIVVELNPTQKDEEPRIELVGIGAVLAAKDDALVLGKVMEGGGAFEAGLATGDRVLAVDGVAIPELGFAGAVQKIRGPEGTKVTLLVQRKSAGPAPVTVVRRRVST